VNDGIGNDRGSGVSVAAADGAVGRKTAAIVAHLGLFTGSGFLLPLIVRITAGRHDDYVKHHSTEALNFALLFSVIFYGLVAVAVYSIAYSEDTTVVFSVVQVVGIPIVIAGYLCSLIAAIRASEGVWWRYPVTIRLIRGAKRRPPVS
jgi:uncharacterized protein